MTKHEQENFDIAQLVIFNQLCIEANDRLKDYPKFFRQNLKRASNELNRELEKHIPVYDVVYAETEEFMQITQQQLEYIIPALRGMRLDELATIPFLIRAYREHRDKTEMFLQEILNVKLK